MNWKREIRLLDTEARSKGCESEGAYVAKIESIETMMGKVSTDYSKRFLMCTALSMVSDMIEDCSQYIGDYAGSKSYGNATVSFVTQDVLSDSSTKSEDMLMKRF